jgi:uncharacterized integral membrane protein
MVTRLRGAHDGDTAARRIGALRLVRSGERRPRPTTTGRLDWWLPVVSGSCAVVGVTLVVMAFALQNSQPVSLRFLDWHVERLPLAVAILAPGIAACCVVTVLALIDRNGLLARIRHLEHRRRETGEPGRRPHRYVRLRRAPVRGSVPSPRA